jgi:hypothetical protein
MVSGLRRSEFAGLTRTDVDFLNLQIDVTRSVVDQHVGRCKTEISQKPVPIDEYLAATCRSGTGNLLTTLPPIEFSLPTATGR